MVFTFEQADKAAEQYRRDYGKNVHGVWLLDPPFAGASPTRLKALVEGFSGQIELKNGDSIDDWCVGVFVYKDSFDRLPEHLPRGNYMDGRIIYISVTK